MFRFRPKKKENEKLGFVRNINPEDAAPLREEDTVDLERVVKKPGKGVSTDAELLEIRNSRAGPAETKKPKAAARTEKLRAAREKVDRMLPPIPEDGTAKSAEEPAVPAKKAIPAPAIKPGPVTVTSRPKPAEAPKPIEPKPAPAALKKTKPAEPPAIKPRASPPEVPAGKPGFRTNIDRLLVIIKERGKIKVGEAAKIFNVKDDDVEEWGGVLEEHGMAELHYPLIGEPILRAVQTEKEKKKVKKEKKKK